MFERQRLARAQVTPGRRNIHARRLRHAMARINRGQQFDVIFSDLMMLTMTGVELYDALLRKNPCLAESVVFVSGGATTAKVDAFLRAVSNLRPDKPFKGAQLLAIAQKALEVAQSRPGRAKLEGRSAH